MAGLRNLAVGVHCQDGHTSIATARRRTPRAGVANPDTKHF
jgi:hypothetical protein